jgi:hypothetical protein
MRAAAAKVVPPICLIVVPVVAYVNLLLLARGNDTLAQDFHNEIYPEAQELLHRHEQFVAGTASITRFPDDVWPPLVGYLAAPLTALSPASADVVIVLVGIACFGAALWTVGVRDWRVYGAASLWGPVIGEMRTAHLTLILCLLVAIVWRTRARTAIAGLTLGLAIGLKFFLWPLVLWLASLRRWREAGIAAATAAASLLLLFTSIGILAYVRVLRALGEKFDQDGYAPYSLLVQLGAPNTMARVVSLAIGAAVVALAWRRRSFGLFVAATLLLSPIVWLDYFAVLAVPLAVVRPSFSWVWLVPILAFGLPSAGVAVGVPKTIWVLVLFTVVVWYTERSEQSASGAASHFRPVVPAGARPAS